MRNASSKRLNIQFCQIPFLETWRICTRMPYTRNDTRKYIFVSIMYILQFWLAKFNFSCDFPNIQVILDGNECAKTERLHVLTLMGFCSVSEIESQSNPMPRTKCHLLSQDIFFVQLKLKVQITCKLKCMKKTIIRWMTCRGKWLFKHINNI